MNKKQQEIILKIDNGEPKNAACIGRMVKISPSATLKYLKELEEVGVTERLKKPKPPRIKKLSFFWILTKKGYRVRQQLCVIRDANEKLQEILHGRN